jgi:hypothetical protein
MTLQLTFTALSGQLGRQLREVEKPIAEAATKAIRLAGNAARDEGRKEIASAGFSRRWQTALRVAFEPKRGNSINCSARLRHSIGYATIFETGGTIQGSPLLWVPLRDAPLPKSSRGSRMTPSQFAKQIGPLASVNVPGTPPLLVAKADRGKRGRSKVTLGALRRGGKGQGNIQTVPVFVGVRSVTIRDRWDLREIFRRVAGRLGQYFSESLDGQRDRN